MKRTPITPKFAVAGQPSLDDIAALAEERVALLINNRPDGEEPGQPGARTEQEAAERAGLGYVDLPVTGGSITREAVAQFREAVLAAPGPVVAHCRSGTRSLTLWVIGEVLAGRMRRDAVEAFGAERGFDLAGAGRWLDAHGEANPG